MKQWTPRQEIALRQLSNDAADPDSKGQDDHDLQQVRNPSIFHLLTQEDYVLYKEESVFF
jgi:hypothetical protein